MKRIPITDDELKLIMDSLDFRIKKQTKYILARTEDDASLPSVIDCRNRVRDLAVKLRFSTKSS